MARSIRQTSLFERHKKRLHRNQLDDLDRAVAAIRDQPQLGEEKSGDLRGVRVYKFHLVKRLFLLAYEDDGEAITLLALDVHENFYRDLKRYRR